MKNIHVLPTGKPSSIGYDGVKNLHFVNDFIDDYQNIYITSDEEIKEGDWMIRDNKQPTKVTPNFFWDFGVRYYKIILTTDQDLIKDGVQAIDDEFLEWFVKNPSCESVEMDLLKRGIYEEYKYKIIIPKESQCTCEIYNDNTCNYCENKQSEEILESAKINANKQETLEEITEQIQNECHSFVESVPNVNYQDATNTFLFMKLAELTLKLKKYE